ncbi:MAG TPA: phosphoribosyltransferase family protein [Candidatus Limnocylindrales bacterium]|nr:phosphoribosyltransferase family protein [Candidatus Limnocylindrales bacterium]
MTNGDSNKILTKYSIEPNNLIELNGPWELGYAIALHSISSIPIDPGRHLYDTTYTPVGKLLHTYKYTVSYSSKDDLVNISIAIIRVKFHDLSIDILTIPPSNSKRVYYQPMEEIAKGVSSNSGIQFHKIFAQKEMGKTMKSIELKNEKRKYLVENIYCGANNIKNKTILIIDDIFDSGATLETCTQKLKEQNCKNVYVLTFTKTR